MSGAAPATGPRFAAGLSGKLDVADAALDAASACAGTLADGEVDLALVFVSADHAEATAEAARTVAGAIGARCLLGVAAEGVIAGPLEIERTPAVAVLAARLPGVTIEPFDLAGATSLTPDPGALAVVLADPFTVPSDRVLAHLSSLPGATPGSKLPVIGGMASAGEQSGGNTLVLNSRTLTEGLVGVRLRGPVGVRTLVSQGCRPFGPIMIVTRVAAGLVAELSGRPAARALHDVIEGLESADRQLLKRGLFLGVVVDEYKERFGRSDFLVRNVFGVDADSGAIAVAGELRVGQTVQFHMRDEQTARQDLAMLLDAQKLYDTPAGVLLVTCNGRGTRLFSTPHHDASAFARALGPQRPGEDTSRAGVPLAPAGVTALAPPALPIGGFFAAGEFGPVGQRSFLHGHTAAAAIFRRVS